MSKCKWFLLIVSLVVVPEIDTAASKRACNLSTVTAGVYCTFICGPAEEYALCFVAYKFKHNIMIGKRQMSKPKDLLSSWDFYPVNYQGKKCILVRHPDSICEKVFEEIKVKEKNKCVPTKRGKYRGNLVPGMEQAVRQALRRNNSATTIPGATRHETDVKRMVNLMRKVKGMVEMIEGLVHLDYGALPLTVTTYTSQEWANATATLTIIRDDAEKDEQPDLVQLVQALDKVLPILNAVTITSEKKRSLGNGQPTKEEEEDVSELTMEEIMGKTAGSDIELPDDLKKEAEELSRAIISLQKAEKKFKPDFKLIKKLLDESDFDFRQILEDVEDFAENVNEKLENRIDFEELTDYTKNRNAQNDEFGEQFPNAGYPGISSQAGGSKSDDSKSLRCAFILGLVGQAISFVGGLFGMQISNPFSPIISPSSTLFPFPFPPSSDEHFVFKDSIAVCQHTRTYFCEQTEVLIYAANDKYCLASYQNYTACQTQSTTDCYQELYGMIEYIKIY